MVFASHIFLGFLSLLLLIYWCVTSVNQRNGKWVLILASLFFYGYWLPAYLILLFASIVFNCGWHFVLRRVANQMQSRIMLAVGIVLNLSLIAYYKYFEFLLETANQLFGAGIQVPEIILPIGISFFTFQQIGFLVDTYRDRVKPFRISDYLLFICFFPQLIAGPIVGQRDMLPQLRNKDNWSLQANNLAIGLAFFTLGLFKKTVLIDPYVPHVDIIFESAASGVPVGFIDGWVAAVGYSFQIYFDFSGYSDMAIGLAMLFGVRLPINFFSPYKSESIRQFWRRWHITLSRFLRDYLYIPLGGSRNGIVYTLCALMVTMGLGGLWHGAGWTFVIWGLLHGFYLSVNHLWVSAGISAKLVFIPIWIRRSLFVLLTYLAVTFAWVYFRAPDLTTANIFAKAMLGMSGWHYQVDLSRGIVPLFPLYFIIVWALPNTIELFRKHNPALHYDDYIGTNHRILLNKKLSFTFSNGWSIVIALAFVVAWFSMSNLSPFIYFQF